MRGASNFLAALRSSISCGVSAAAAGVECLPATLPPPDDAPHPILAGSMAHSPTSPQPPSEQHCCRRGGRPTQPCGGSAVIVQSPVAGRGWILSPLTATRAVGLVALSASLHALCLSTLPRSSLAGCLCLPGFLAAASLPSASACLCLFRGAWRRPVRLPLVRVNSPLKA